MNLHSPIEGCAFVTRRNTIAFNSMDIFYTVVTAQATYHFVVNHEVGLARITKLIRKGNKGADCSTTMSVDTARKFARQLQAR